MKILKKPIFLINLTVLFTFLLTSCSSSNEAIKLTNIIVQISRTENCDLSSSSVRENGTSSLDLKVKCEIEDSFRYGKFLMTLVEMLEEENIVFQRYIVLNDKDEEQLSIDEELYRRLSFKKKQFESVINRLKKNEIETIVSEFNTELIGVNDSTLIQTLQNKYNLNGQVRFSGFQIDEYEFKGITTLTLVTFAGRNRSNREVTVTFNLAANDNMIYGIDF